MADSELVPVGHKPIDIGEGIELEHGRRGDWIWQMLDTGDYHLAIAVYLPRLYKKADDGEVTLHTPEGAANMPPLFARAPKESKYANKKFVKRILFNMMGWEWDAE